MPAEPGQQVTALGEFLVHRVLGDRTAGTLDSLPGVSENQRRAVIPLADPPGHNPCQALVEIRQIDDQHRILLGMLPLDP